MGKKKQRVKSKAVCVFRWDGKILVSKGYDHAKEQSYYRPLGGNIEFGEYGQQTVMREIMEEIRAEVVDVCFLGMLENIFVYENHAGHEIMLIYDGRFVDESLYDEQLIIQGYESGQAPFHAVWKSLDMFRSADAPPLYPDGLLHLLDNLNA